MEPERPASDDESASPAHERRREDESRLLLAAAVEFSDDAIVGKNLDGIITTWNAGAERVFGYAPHEAIGQSITLIVPPEYLREEEQIVARLRRGERIEHLETVRRRKDGTPIDVSLVISPIKDALGRITGACKIARDITERKRAEEALRQSEARFRALAEKLETKVQERTAQLRASLDSFEELLYTIAHDLRAPTRHIRGFAQLLQLGYASQLDDEARDYLNRINATAARNDDLIRDLLEFGRLSHKAVLLAPVDLGGTVEAVLQSVESEIQRRRAHVRVDREWPLVMANERMLKEIVTHLVTNALIYVPSDREPEMVISARSQGGKAVLRVKDNGVGIPREQIDRVFEPFIRLPNSTNASGTGMGLAIAKKAAERLNGALGAESTLGIGSCFWLELRAA